MKFYEVRAVSMHMNLMVLQDLLHSGKFTMQTMKAIAEAECTSLVLHFRNASVVVKTDINNL